MLTQLLPSFYDMPKIYFFVKQPTHFRLLSMFYWSLYKATPIRIKRIIVEKHQISRRRDEEIVLIKKEMANFIAFYLEVVIPHLERAIVDLQDKLESEWLINGFSFCNFDRQCFWQYFKNVFHFSRSRLRLQHTPGWQLRNGDPSYPTKFDGIVFTIIVTDFVNFILVFVEWNN